MRQLTELEQSKLQHGECPLCSGRDIREGPHGGLCINWRCHDCGATFNLGVPWRSGFFPAELITPEQPIVDAQLLAESNPHGLPA
jgi:hypothetical protein